MDDFIRHTALSQMCKTAATEPFTAAGRDALRQLALQRLCKLAQTASDAATTTTPVPKPASTTSSGDIPAWKKAKRAIRKREEAGEYKRDAAPSHGDRTYTSSAWAQAGRNLGHGLASLGTGLTKGLLSIPGAITGAVGALGYGLTGNGFGAGWDAGKGLVENHIGVGKYDIGWLKRRVGSLQQANTDAYMENNNMDPNSMSTLDRMGMFGMGLANGAGEAIGDAVAWNGIMGMAGKGVNLARKGLSSGWNALEAARGGTGTLANISNNMHRVMDPIARGARSVASRFHLPGGAGGAAAETASTAGSAAAGAAGGAAGGASSSFGAFRPGNLLNAYMAKTDAWDPARERTNNFISSTGDFIRTPSTTPIYPWDDGYTPGAVS